MDRNRQRGRFGGSIALSALPLLIAAAVWTTVALHAAPAPRPSTTDAGGRTASAYDERDRLTELTYPDGRRLLYAHDAAGNRTSLTAVLGATTLVTTYAHDPLGRLDTVTDPDGRVHAHGYDENGNRASLAHPNGVTTTYTYDAANRLTSLGSLGPGGAAVQSYGYTLGLAGNRTAVLEHDGTTRAYTYDALFRLTGERVTGAARPIFEDAFTYDPVGNRLRLDRTDAGGTTTTPSTYDTRDRLLTAGAETLTWDATGNLTARTGPAGATYTWDVEDRLVAVEKPDGTVVIHAYDADGNRVRTEITPATGPPTVRDLLVDTSGALSHAVAETDAAGELISYLVRGDDLLAALRPSTGPRFFHADGLGSIRALTDETGAVTDRYTFTAFGELLDYQGADENGYLFAGEPLDPNSGFYHLLARWLDPGTGRFVGMDPFEGRSLDPISLHKYLYASLDPANAVDPSGRETLSAQLSAISIRSELALGSILTSLRFAFQAGDGGTIGRLFVQLGARAQAAALQVLQLFPRVQIGTARLLQRSLDYSLTSHQRFALFEAKYSIPRGGEAFARLIAQLREASVMLPRLSAGAQRSRIVFWTYRAPRSVAEIQRVSDALGPAAKDVQFVHGLEGLHNWMRLFFGT